ncbi:hypothetical protein D9M71_496630 [compost metagenome]
MRSATPRLTVEKPLAKYGRYGAKKILLSGYRPKPADWPSIMSLAFWMRCSGTKASRTIRVLLPLPRMPTAYQSSRIS